jgi:hypothetical protein
LYCSSRETESKKAFVELIWDEGYQAIQIVRQGLLSGKTACKEYHEDVLCDYCWLEEYLESVGPEGAFPELKEDDFKFPDGAYGKIRLNGHICSSTTFGDYGYEYDAYFEVLRQELHPLTTPDS